jgi:hypothetical protein
VKDLPGFKTDCLRADSELFQSCEDKTALGSCRQSNALPRLLMMLVPGQ